MHRDRVSGSLHGQQGGIVPSAVKVFVLASGLATLGSSVAISQQPLQQQPLSLQRPVVQTAAPPARSSRPAPAPQQPRQAEAPVETPRLIYSPWIKFCPKPLEPDAKAVCYTAMDSTTEVGLPMASAVLIETEGESEKTLRISLPNALQLQPGIRIVIDQNAPTSVPFYTCLANGCIANSKATPQLIDRLKKGQTLVIQAYRITGSVINVTMPLVDFAKANEGPPIDPKELEARQKSREELLLKRSEEARRKGEYPQGPAATP